jgi:superfamily II DNA or RNA helicase
MSVLKAFGQLRAATHAAMDLLPFQLEPALALVQGRASRFLLADEVGLGKTVQAGLMLAELLQRGWCEHALIITPPGLRDQWADELARRFEIPSSVIDAAELSALASSLPPDVNPWTAAPVAIASIDYVKQPEVLAGLAELVWDLLIVDEAHQASSHSLRRVAISALAARARHTVLVTATPHQGDDQAYRSLCSIGEVGPSDEILLFRRTRKECGISGTRRVSLLRVRLSHEALTMHARLDAYVARLWQIGNERNQHQVRLAAMVLAKRSFSSAFALALTADRRRDGLSTADVLPQPALPFDVDESDDAQVPFVAAFEGLTEERDVLLGIVDAARRAQSADRKLHVLAKFLRRVREPAIVFTEYRDTLEAIAAALAGLGTLVMLHGGQTAHDRHQALTKFTGGEADLLIATDAGSEGLNLQRRCRLVINFELPWNPIRLEQRIGRVDRLGQTRPVHAISFLADGTAESEVLAALLRRVDRIRMRDMEIAACIFNRQPFPSGQTRLDDYTSRVDLLSAANAEVRRATILRQGRSAPRPIESNIVPVTIAPRRRPSLVALMRVRLVTRAGRLIDEAIVPLHCPLRGLVWPRRRKDVREIVSALLEEMEARLVQAAHHEASRRADAISVASAGWVARTLSRERQLAEVFGDGGGLTQAGLFDNRTDLRRRQARRLKAARDRLSDARSACVEGQADVVVAHAPEVALVILGC